MSDVSWFRLPVLCLFACCCFLLINLSLFINRVQYSDYGVAIWILSFDPVCEGVWYMWIRCMPRESWNLLFGDLVAPLFPGYGPRMPWWLRSRNLVPYDCELRQGRKKTKDENQKTDQVGSIFCSNRVLQLRVSSTLDLSSTTHKKQFNKRNRVWRISQTERNWHATHPDPCSPGLLDWLRPRRICWRLHDYYRLSR